MATGRVKATGALAEAFLKKSFTLLQSMPTLLLEWGIEIFDSYLPSYQEKRKLKNSLSLFKFLVGFLQVVWNNDSIDQNYYSACLAQSTTNKKTFVIEDFLPVS